MPSHLAILTRTAMNRAPSPGPLPRFIITLTTSSEVSLSLRLCPFFFMTKTTLEDTCTIRYFQDSQVKSCMHGTHWHMHQTNHEQILMATILSVMYNCCSTNANKFDNILYFNEVSHIINLQLNIIFFYINHT